MFVMEHSNIQSVGNCANQIKTHKDANLFKNTHGLIVIVEEKDASNTPRAGTNVHGTHQYYNIIIMGDETPSPSSSPKLGEDSPDKETIHEGSNESPDDDNDHHRDETLPAPWEAYQDDEGRTYYFNADTGETTWDKPMSGVEVDEGDQDYEQQQQQQGDEMENKEEKGGGGGDAGEERASDQAMEEEEKNQENEGEWIAYQDDEGREYYYNTVTQVTQWDKPENFEPPSEDGKTDDVREEADPSLDKSTHDNDNDNDDKSIVEAGEVAEEEAEEEKVVELSEEEKKQIETKSTLDTLSSSDMMLEPGSY